MSRKEIKSLFRPSLFWDADDIDPRKHAPYIIARILDYGDIGDLKRLLTLYGRQEIAAVIRSRRGLLPKTGKYWAHKLGIPFEEVACLRKYYQKRH